MESESQNGEDEPPNAILTKKQRNRLNGEGEWPTRQSKYQDASRIRERLRWAIYDFWIIYDNWDELNVDKAFEGREPHWYLMDGAPSVISTLYRALDDKQLSFKMAVGEGISRAESDMNDRNVDVRLDVDPKVPGGVYVSDAARRVNPDDVDSLRIPEMRAILRDLAQSDVDVYELLGGTHWDEMIDDTDDE